MPSIFLIALAAATAAPDPLGALFAPVTGADRPGCAVDIRRDGAVVARRSFGMANLETATPIAPDTVFEAGSVSKQFIGAGVALLASRGRLSLDDKLRRWLPELPPLYDAVTLRMLLNHTSGIRNWDNLAELTGVYEYTDAYDNDWVLRSAARQTRLNNRPGAEYLYSNSNYVLAAIVVARAAGKPVNAFFREALFGPFGMTYTQWRDDFRRVVPGRAQAYTSGPGGWRIDMPNNNVFGAGALLTTTGDLQRWNAALDAPGPEDRAWVSAIAEPGRLADGTRLRYGLGLEIDDIAGAAAISHAGATAGYRTWLGRFPASRLSVALLCNNGDLNTEDLGPELAALYLPKAAAAPAPPAAPGPAIPGVAGLYRNAANDSLVTVVQDAGAVRFNNGPRFTLGTDGALVSADGKRRARLTRGKGGEVAEIALTRVANSPVALVRTAPWAPGPRALAAFAGRFRSVDVDGDQTLSPSPDGLRWIDPSGRAQPLKPLYTDAFEAPESSWTLRFTRDAHGRVTAFDASITRARQIHFSKVAER